MTLDNKKRLISATLTFSSAFLITFGGALVNGMDFSLATLGSLAFSALLAGVRAVGKEFIPEIYK